ncbi:membrane-associated protease RseP (regulator of RpoE activity) [Neobacillus niacini]|uniref:site-2 protease family protein n=1 Tax=Neobacillus niacini TaxID=86668 RepID=UPI00285AA9F9|nr:site-2 protease family protein [Neobacillus niacini]MDR7080184.1 membrane-associated protease RseP (regulator of RpoE activity) [Neobacillus niacini]
MYFLMVMALTLASMGMIIKAGILLTKEVIGKNNKDDYIGKALKLALYGIVLGSLSSYLLKSPPLTLMEIMLILKLIFILFLVVTLHEMGHYLAARLFNVSVSTFSVGVGPKLLRFKYSNTDFQFHVIPIMGYVKPDSSNEQGLSPIKKCIFYLAGIVVNIICFFIGLTVFFIQQGQSVYDSFVIVYNKFVSLIPMFYSVIANLELSDVITPEHDLENNIGVYISMANIAQEFWLGFAVLSIMLALFNMIPIPVLDGGRVVLAILGSLFALIGIPKKYINASFTWLLLLGALILYSPIIINNLWATSIDVGMTFPEYLLWMGIILTAIINIQIFLENRRNNNTNPVE